MKKSCFLVFAVFIFSVSCIQAQSFHFGIKAGTNLSQISGRSFDDGFQWGFSAGGFAEINFDKKWGIQPELLFNQTKTQTADDFDEVFNEGFNSTSVTLNYLSIPVLASFKLLPVLSIQVGPQFGILMSTSQDITSNASKAFKSGDFSLVGGAQVNLGGFKTGIRYVYGLTNLAGISEVENVDTWKNQNIQFYIGFRII
jgi:Outer membrane protein beta-barrel domain